MWEYELRNYENRDYILNGLKNKFRIESVIAPSFARHLLSKKSVNIRYSKVDKIAITDWIKKGLGRYIAGPYQPGKSPIKLHFSPLFTVHQPNKIRTIQNLSYPKLPASLSDLNVNNLLNPAWCTVDYIRFRDVVNMFNNAGRNAYYFVLDAVDAYYRIPVHENDHYLMGFTWAGYEFFMTCLQMGLGSACRIYTHFSDALLYIVLNNNKIDDIVYNAIIMLRHYLDDFFGANPSKAAAQRVFNSVKHWFRVLGVPTNEKKCKEPRKVIIVLGWQYNSRKLEVSIPKQKLDHIVPWLKKVIADPITDVQELHSLVGHLRWASQAIYTGQAFLRRIESHLHALGLEVDDLIVLDHYAIEELKWWLKQLEHASHGIPYELLLKRPSDTEINIYSDAAGKKGMGGWTRGHYFQIFWEETICEEVEKIRFPDAIKEENKHFIIAFQEFFGAVTSAYAFRHQIRGKCIKFWIDNTNAQSWIASKTPPLQSVDCQYLMRKLADLANEYKFYFWVDRIAGKVNNLADRLSRHKNLYLGGNALKGGFIRHDVSEFVNQCYEELKQQPLNGRLSKKVVKSNEKFNKKWKFDRYRKKRDILERSQKPVK